jgi:uncharacterized repeat protein (TIGR03803 family)
MRQLLSSLVVPLTARVAILLLASSAWGAPKYKVLHAFTGGKDGGGLYGGLVFNDNGSIYGTTGGGGAYGYGTVFELDPYANGKWREHVLRSFKVNDPDGDEPQAGLVFDSLGNLYGTTCCGGAHASGTAFELSPGSQGWTETVLYDFCSRPECSDGGSPHAGLAIDKAGNLYGTGGTAFELSPGADGWTLTVLHDFLGQHGDGYGPYAGVVLGADGNVYGTTQLGGNPLCAGGGCGTAYELRRMPDGKWKEIVLHKFGAYTGDGQKPGLGALVSDGAGSLYGTTGQGGTHLCSAGCGTVFKLRRQPDGRWKETVIYDFRDGASGNTPEAGVVLDKKGNLYGTTVYGGSGQCSCGVVYKLSTASNGKWRYTVLHTFTGSDGAQPGANLILDSKGKLYGTTTTGGAGGAGVAFELTP